MRGAVAEVTDSVSFVSGSKRTYAYQLPDGNYIKAADCELLEEGTEQAAFTGLSASEENGIEYLTFTAAARPITPYLGRQRVYAAFLFRHLLR